MNKKKICFSLIAVLSMFVTSVSGITLRITCRSKGVELELCRKVVDEWLKKYGNQHKVEIITLPHASNECFALYQQLLSAETFDVDIFQMDIAWIGVFSEYLADLNEIYGKNSTDDPIDLDDYFPAIRESMYCNGNMVALPWYADCGVMYYRKDLLEKYGKPVPKTWEELYETAEYIQNQERQAQNKQNRFFGFVFQAKAFEMLTCNFVEFLDSFGGAVIINGKSAVSSEEALDTMLFFVKCLKNISSKSVLNYSEEDARGAFQSGNAVFMSNWPYAWSLMNHPSTAVAGKTEVMPIPPRSSGKGKPSGVLGGWFLTVSKYSKHKELAADLIKFLTSKAQQKIRAQYSYLPTFKSLYRDEIILKQNPFFGKVYDSMEHAVTRPSMAFGKNYLRASTEIFNIVNTILADSLEDKKYGEREIRRNLKILDRHLNKILRKTKVRSSESSSDKGVFSAVESFVLSIAAKVKNFF